MGVQYQNLDDPYSMDIKIIMVHYSDYKATFDTNACGNIILANRDGSNRSPEYSFKW